MATGVSLAAYGSLFDTVSVCFSKGLGAPVGSVLVSTADRIAQARIWRKRLGGGWRQAGILAAGALHALDHHVDRLADDHQAAAAFAPRCRVQAPWAVDVAAVQTNIVVLNTGAEPAAQVATAAKDQGVWVSALGPRMLRAVTHLDVTVDEARTAGEVVGSILGASR